MNPGYEQTEIGVIPEEWEAKPFGEVAVPRREKINPRRTGVHDFCIELEHIESGSGQILGSTRTGTQASLKSVFQPGDVLFGKLRAYLRKYWRATRHGVCSTEIWVLVPRSDAATSEFLFQIVQTDDFIDAASNSYGTHMPRSDWNVVQNHELRIPPLPEQRAIATALSDVDGLLGGLDRLIAKKRDLKQAAMQQLLTGQTRLPGFHGEWEVKRLGDVGEISSAGVDKKIRPDEVPVRLVNYLDVYRKDFIYSEDLNYWVTAPPQQAKRCAVQKGDVFFTPTSETRDDIGISAVAMEDIPDAVYSYHVARLRLREPWDLCFRTYAFKTRAFLDQAETLCDGNGTRYVISQGKFRSMSVKVPPIPEQTAIASVLTEMDGELAVLEQRREKTRALKQAMMQELLTGRTRLV